MIFDREFAEQDKDAEFVRKLSELLRQPLPAESVTEIQCPSDLPKVVPDKEEE